MLEEKKINASFLILPSRAHSNGSKNLVPAIEKIGTLNELVFYTNS